MWLLRPLLHRLGERILLVGATIPEQAPRETLVFLGDALMSFERFEREQGERT